MLYVFFIYTFIHFCGRISSPRSIFLFLDDNIYSNEEDQKYQYSSRENSSSNKSQTQIKSSLWQEGGTGNRIFGDEIAESAVNKSNKSLKGGNKNSKRKKANERAKMRRQNRNESSDEDNESKRCEPLAAMQTLSI